MTSAVQTRTISVFNEWGKLREAFVGIAPDNMIEPDYVPAFSWMDEEGIEITRTYAGKKSLEIFPEWIAELREQIEAYVAILVRHGVTVHRNVPLRHPEEEHFLADTQRGLVVSGGADFFLVIGSDVILLNNLRYPFRRKQIYTVRPVLEPLLQGTSARYVALPPASPHYDETDTFLERGDVMIDGSNVYVGMSGNATSPQGVAWLRQYLGANYHVYTITLNDKILHLDTVFMLNRPGLLTYYPQLVGELPLPLRHWDKIEVHAEPGEQSHFGANWISLDEHTIVVADEYKRLVPEYEKRGMNVITTPLGMSMRYGSGSRCLTGILHREP